MDEEIAEYANNYIDIDVTFAVICSHFVEMGCKPRYQRFLIDPI